MNLKIKTALLAKSLCPNFFGKKMAIQFKSNKIH